MLLNNYYNYCQIRYHLPVVVKLPNGNNSTLSYYSTSIDNIEDSIKSCLKAMPQGTEYGSAYGGVIFGTGTTPVALTDYTLSGSVISNFDYNVVRTLGNDYVEGAVAVSATADITINEVGFVLNCRTAAATMRNFLIARIVLNNPINIANGGLATIKVRFTSTGLEVQA